MPWQDVPREGRRRMKSIIERAVELASSGSYSTVSAIREQLMRENFPHVDANISGALTRRQLTAPIAAARANRNPGSTDTKPEGNEA